MTAYSSIEDILQDLNWYAESRPNPKTGLPAQGAIDLCKAALTVIMQMQLDLENCKKDAKRYQWLKKSDWYIGPDNFYCTEGGKLVEMDDKNGSPDILDEAIDTAMEKKGE